MFIKTQSYMSKINTFERIDVGDKIRWRKTQQTMVLKVLNKKLTTSTLNANFQNVS